ncbi:cytochrome c551 [Bacillus sp. UMB0893]|uniref:cytochrome c551 n=1 Tax=Bacillus sp. UMB0893 TaxID=2066053 RepID=UPI000C7836A6|nr:cytochrome c [Bacillus sp. UMB0893]PLR67992.1 cytochrome C551 [Bacillus sp. UMB0893]
MKRKLFALLFGTSLALAACGGGDDTQEEPKDGSGSKDTANAEEIVQQNCISCHGQNLEGGGAAPNLTKVGAKYDQKKIEGIINNGQGGMPGGLISESDATVVAEWLAEKK